MKDFFWNIYFFNMEYSNLINFSNIHVSRLPMDSGMGFQAQNEEWIIEWFVYGVCSSLDFHPK
jgi:hypothetical protein